MELYAREKQEVTALKIIVFSDSHGDLSNMANTIEKEQPDLMFHLGDHWRDAEEVEWAYPELKIYKVPGNCDWRSTQPTELLLTLDGCRLLLCHGHTFGVKMGYSELAHHAADQQVHVALFGHTHRAHWSRRGRMQLFNPGSCGMGIEPTYGILTVENGTATCQIKKIFEED